MTESIRVIHAEKAADTIRSILVKKLEDDESYTGKIIFELNCSEGGVGNIDAYIKRKIGLDEQSGM